MCKTKTFSWFCFLGKFMEVMILVVFKVDCIVIFSRLCCLAFAIETRVERCVLYFMVCKSYKRESFLVGNQCIPRLCLFDTLLNENSDCLSHFLWMIILQHGHFSSYFRAFFKANGAISSTGRYCFCIVFWRFCFYGTHV